MQINSQMTDVAHFSAKASLCLSAATPTAHLAAPVLAQHLGISRHDEVQSDGMGVGVLRKVGEAAALPLIVDVRFCTFHELLLFHVLLLGPLNTRMDQ